MRLASLIFLVLFCAFPSQSLACSCAVPDLKGSYESSSNVFTAVVTGARYDDDGNIEADFEVTETFKGDIPFDMLRTTRSGTSCDTNITVGPEYLFFMGDTGGFGGCSVHPVIEPGKPMPWLDVLQAYKAGTTPDLSSPWEYFGYNGTCILTTKFRATADSLKSYLRMEYRYAVPEKPVWTDERLNKAGYSSAVFILPTREEPEDAKLIVTTPNREFVAKWADDARPARVRGAFQLTGEDVMAFANELRFASKVQVEGSLARYPSISGTVIQTTNAGNAISDFVNCASQ